MCQDFFQSRIRKLIDEVKELKLLPFFASIPHSGEKIPAECSWLLNLPEPTLMRDVDRFVDRLYEKSLQDLGISFTKTEWHRYAVDLNRIPQDIDASSVQGSSIQAGKNARGFHWVHTTQKEPLMNSPMTIELHQKLTQVIYEPFHASIQDEYKFRKEHGYKNIYHLDLHSMPSKGTSEHRDPGETRAEIVISDSMGKSASKEYVDLILTSYLRAGLQVRYNWPYFGGRLTEEYGKPNLGQHCVQVEINRSLYMDEVTKKWIPEKAQVLIPKLKFALELIKSGILDLEK